MAVMTTESMGIKTDEEKEEENDSNRNLGTCVGSDKKGERTGSVPDSTGSEAGTDESGGE